jgi:hypothetical protein
MVISRVRQREMKTQASGHDCRGRASIEQEALGVASQANHVIYQLPIDGLPDPRARTTMPVMRTPKEAGEVSC